ncbi:MAG: phosphoribosyl-AMP cyclohydrolase [Alphaproteobacteria bacterium]
MIDKVSSRHDREEGSVFDPVFDANGLIPAVVTHAETGAPLMVAYMNAEAIDATRKTGEAHYWSRSRQELWHKGATSGQIQAVVEMLTDCDQDAIWLKVLPQGDGGCCHVGYRTCFYRKVGVDGLEQTGEKKLKN